MKAYKSYLLAMSMLAALVSCNGNMEELQTVGDVANETTFTACMDGNIGDNESTRTYLQGLSTLWNAGDQISVNGTVISLKSGQDTRYGVFQGNVSAYSGGYYAGYPASATTFNDGTMTLAIPATQTYNASNPLLGQMPMAAYATADANGNVALNFKNAANILKLNLWSSTANVSRIVISSSAAPLSGTVPVTVSGGDVIFGNMTSTSKSICLNCETPVTVSTDENSPTPFYFIIPKLEANTVLTVRVYDSSNNCQENNITVSDSKNNGLMTAANKLYATNSQAYSPVAGPYVAFEGLIKVSSGNSYTVTTQEYMANDNTTIAYHSDNTYEKIAFPINNLEVGEWYTITFGENVTRVAQTDGVFWEEVACYTTSVRASGAYSTSSGYANTLPNTTNSGEYYVWAHSPGTFNNNDYTAVTQASTTFYASAPTMYWVWDLSKLQDDNSFLLKFYLTGTRIQKIERSNTTPRVDLVNCIIRYYVFSGDDKCLPTYKIYADNQRLEMQIVPKTSNWEKINIPIVNLTIGHNYRLTFDYHRTFHGTDNSTNDAELDKNSGHSGYDLCFGVAQKEMTDNDNTNLHGKSNTSSDTDYYTYTDNILVRDITGQTIEFTAKATTMYWVWAQCKILDGKRCTQRVENVTLEDITTP